ncbi:MAG: CBS domain-containing protein [Phycisphaerales bacterium]|nr:CBS domain-containing protein [Phycisphaerales bacterium]
MGPAVTVAPGATIGATIGLMQKNRVGCVVVQEVKKAVGIFTERDVLSRVLAGGAALDDPIRTVMTPNPRTLRGEENLATVVRTMHAGGLRHLPVVDENGTAVGMVSIKRIIQHLVEHFPQAVYNLPPDPAVVATARDGG